MGVVRKILIWATKGKESQQVPEISVFQGICTLSENRMASGGSAKLAAPAVNFVMLTMYVTYSNRYGLCAYVNDQRSNGKGYAKYNS